MEQETNWWVEPLKCNACKTTFMCDEEEIMFYFNAETETTKRFVRCPVCFEYVKVEVDTNARND